MNDWTTLDLVLVTPLISKGAGQEAEFRIPSLLGALRHTTESVSPDMTRTLFGDIDSPNPFQWRLTEPPNPTKQADPVKAFGRHGTTLAQLITAPDNGGNYRVPSFISPGTKVSLMLRPRSHAHDVDQAFDHLMGYLDAASILTGMGGKTSRGFGGFRIEAVTGALTDQRPYKPKTPLSGYRELIRQLDGTPPNGEARHPLDKLVANVGWAWLSKETFSTWQAALAVGADALHRLKRAIGLVDDKPDAGRLALFGKPIKWNGKNVSKGRLPSPFRLRILPAGQGYRLAAYHTRQAHWNHELLHRAHRDWDSMYTSALTVIPGEGEIVSIDTSPGPHCATAPRPRPAPTRRNGTGSR